MIKLEVFLPMLLIVSTLTSLGTEAIKKILTEYKVDYKANTLAGIVAMIIGAGVGIGYFVISEAAITASAVVCIVALIFMCWLCAMVGYDKVIQAIAQFKKSDENV